MSAPHLHGRTRVAGVVGSPVGQSLSPLIHNAWIAEAGLEAVYVPLCPAVDRFPTLVDGLRGGSVAGLNVTLPFKETALRLADRADAAASAAGAANLLLFHPDGSLEARNTDGLGLLHAFSEQAPHWRPADAEVVVLGAGGAARGAVAALTAAGARVVVVNRTAARAEALAAAFEGVRVAPLSELGPMLGEASALINATAGGMDGKAGVDVPLDRSNPALVVMDMVYKPIRTPLLAQAKGFGRTTVDGLAMLIGQAIPSFEAFFGRPPPVEPDVRALALHALGAAT